MRRLIAERMSRANRDIPHYHLALDVDVEDVFADLAELNETLPIAERILPAALYVHAVGRALARHPAFNGFWIDDAFQPGERVNVAMAISLRRGGLMTPHVEGADELSLGETMARLTELVTAARTGNLKARWMTGSTITVTNLGDLGADLVHGVVSPPQVALVGVGRPRARGWVVDGQVVPRTVLTLTLAADHRATDGMTGSRFLNTIADNLTRLPEEP
jgi:pyruvate dehydrogenase E2 component (dihydrolipoamide acetyltransferase)